MNQNKKESFIVRGRVVTNAGVAARGLKVLAIDKNPGKEIVLGEAITDSSGTYTILYKKEPLQKRGKQKADIEIEIIDPEEESKIYGTSSVHFDADKEEEINLVLQTESVEKRSEYIRITSDLQPKIGEVAFKDLQENKERQEISYLANKTGWDARLVAMVSLADKYRAASGIPAEFYFALFRAGVSTDVDAMYRTNSGTVKKIWEKAIEENIIEVSLKRTIKRNIAKFEENGSIHLLENAKPIGVSSLKELLGISLQNPSDQLKFVKLYFNHVGDMSRFWANAKTKIGQNAVEKLQLDGKLGYLTVNNAKLIGRLRSDNRVQESPVDLIKNGLYKPEAWDTVLGNDIPVPKDMPGETDEEKKKNYINYMVSMLKISYPTSVVAEMVHNNELPVKGGSKVEDEVYKFLQDGKFEIGVHPVEKFIEENNTELGKKALNETKRLQRVYQVSPSDNAMTVLWKNKLDSALSIVQYDEKEFIETFGKDLCGEDIAKMTYAKAHQVHSTVLNIAISYLTYRTSPRVYAISGAKENVNPHDPDLISYPTLEELFGSMDYCTCGHCKSVLSPAAYLVDLLQFIDRKKYEKKNPIEVLLKRRPDIEHIQLTCENTNTVLPYIDLVNEILEYYVVNKEIEGFKGHNVEDITSEELLANPQFVNNQAYKILKEEVYPFNLPFNQSLEALRLYYGHLKVPLHEAMEKLRVDDRLDTPGGAGQPPYAWPDIYNEYLGISPEEYAVLTNSEAKELPAYFGEEESMPFYKFNEKYFNAKEFSRKTDITYNDLIEIIKTQFINPDSHLIPKLEKLRISFAAIKKFKEGRLSDEKFEKKIPFGLDISIYGRDAKKLATVKKWVKDNCDKIMSLILLTPPPDEEVTECEFAKSELRYSLPDNNQNLLKEIDYWRLLRFIRLWKKLGWTIEETDKVIAALYKVKPAAADNINTQKQKLDDGFKDLIIKIALLKEIQEKLDLKGRDSFIKLLSLWSNIDTHGGNSLYKKMFLHSSILKIDTVFDDNGYGKYLTDTREMIKGHLLALEAAFNVTADELSLILNDADFDKNSLLSLENVSKIYRYRFLAKALKISIQELITIKAMSGMDPFHELEDVHPSTLKFIELVQLIKQSDFKINTLSYFLQHEDVTGKASPSRDSILSLAKTLKDGLVKIEQDYMVEDDPTGEIAKSKMALVYENAVVDNFFGLLKGTTSYSVEDYSQSQPELEQELKDISDKIAYDHFQKRLNFQGVMTEAVKTNFDNAASATDDFKTAIQELYDAAQADFSDFFDKYPDLKTLYDGYVASNKPEPEKIADILEDFLPSLKKKLKHLFIKQTLSSSVNVDLSLLNELLERQRILHSIEQDDKPAIEDFLKLEGNGVSAQYFFADNTSTTQDITLSGIAFNRGTVTKSEFPNSILVLELLREGIIKEIETYTDHVYFSDSIKDESQLKGRLEEVDINRDEIVQVLAIWRQTDNKLPANPAGADAKISAIWRFYLDVPVNGNYNYHIVTDKDAKVNISIDKNEIEISDDPGNGIRQNREAIELKAGRLYRVELEIAKVKDKAVLKWESKGIGRESIPLKYLYPYEQVHNFSDMYIRLLKAIGIFERLGLEEKEIAFFCTAENISFQIDGKGFLNAIPVTPNPDGNKVVALFTILLDLLRYVELKKSLKVNDENLVMILNDPEVKAENGDSLLLKVTGWDKSSQEDLLERFGWVQDDLKDLNKFIRLNEAFGVVNKFGVPVAHLVNGTTNQPVADTVRDIQNSLRAKYDESVWLTALQPINDQLRSCQRDALVSYILHEMQKNEATENINTPDKLFEYFFIDVEMDPCMKTSRIKQAISTVQLFIQRCLMNLEPEVSPAAIKTDQWEWMKRYRVWEANRKIFLYPENWLEPELRDNKSPFFRDLESELLQADITDDLAETALLNYLEKLDDVSMLEISGMYLQESDDILQVFGRTTGASRKYYYRRFDGNWTPWEKVDLDIEDNPILPVVWKNRLFLFWLNIVRKGPDGKELPSGGNKTKATDIEIEDINKRMIEKIEINLSWSEYFNNKWQPRKTSDFDSPIKLRENAEEGFRFRPGDFKREHIKISSFFDDSGLMVDIQYLNEMSHYFKLFNKHSAHLEGSCFANESETMRDFDDYENKLSITYKTKERGPTAVITKELIEHKILTETSHYDITETHHKITNIFEAPFFYQDSEHVFFVKPEERLTTVSDPQNVGVLCLGLIPALTIEEEPFTPLRERPDVDVGPWITDELLDVPVGIRPDDPRTIDLSHMTVSVNKVVSDNRTVIFGDEIIGPIGSQHAHILYDKVIGKANFEMINIKGVLK